MIIATAGHVDHGKTALVRALTGIDADRLPEERARGLTVDLGFAYRHVTDAVTLGFVDVPGHERFIRNMLAGVGGIGMALLVVAADDGPMPQTREHLAILDLLGLRRGAVAITKIDRVSAARVRAVTMSVRELLATTALRDAPSFAVSSVSGEGIAELEQHLTAAAMRARMPTDDGLFRLPIDRAFHRRGLGQVVTGTVLAGRVEAGAELLLSAPASERRSPVRVRSLHVQDRPAARAQRGDRCALQIVGPQLDGAAIRRGDWVLAAPLSQPTQRLDLRLRVLDDLLRPVAHWSVVHVHVGAAHVTGRLALLESRELASGASGLARLVLDRCVEALAGDRVIIRDQAAAVTLGGGSVIDPAPPARGRARPQRLAELAALEEGEPAARLRQLLALRPGGVALRPWLRAWNRPLDTAPRLIEQAQAVLAPAGGTGIAFSWAHWDALKSRAIGVVARYHEQMPQQRGLDAPAIRTRLGITVDAAALDAALASLLEEGALARRATIYHRPGHRPQPSADERAWWQRVEGPLRERGRQTPPLRELAVTLGCNERELEAFLLRAVELGWLVRVARSFFVPPDIVQELAATAERLAEHSADGRFTVAEYRDAAGIGRNLSVRVLEHFDQCGLTQRIGDHRRLRRR